MIRKFSDYDPVGKFDTHLDDVGLLVHDDNGRRAEAGLGRHQGVKVHQYVVAHPDKYHTLIMGFKVHIRYMIQIRLGKKIEKLKEKPESLEVCNI